MRGLGGVDVTGGGIYGRAFQARRLRVNARVVYCRNPLLRPIYDAPFKFPWQASPFNDGKGDGVSSVNIVLMSSLSF